MDQLTRRRPTAEQIQTPSRAEIASGTPSKVRQGKAPPLPKTAGKVSKGGTNKTEEEPQVASLPASSILQSTPIVESPSTSGKSVSIKERDQLLALGPSSEMTSANTSSTSKGKHDGKDVTKDKKKKRSGYERSRGRSSTRGPSRSYHKKRRHYSSDSDSDSSSDDSSNDVDSSSGPDSEQERRMRKRARSKSRARSRARGRARSRSRAHFSDSDSGSDSESSMLEPVFMTFTIPNGDARMRQFDPAISFAKLLEKTYALANINQEIPINMSYDFNGMRLQLKDDDDLRALMDAAILKDLMLNIKVEKVELSSAHNEIAASSSKAPATPVKKKRSRGSKKVESTDDGDSSVDVPLSTIKVSEPQIHHNGKSFVSLETNDDVPLARIMITEGESNKEEAKTAAEQGQVANGVGIENGSKRAADEPEKKDTKKKKRTKEEMAEAKALKAKEKEEKAARKAAEKEAKRLKTNEERRRKSAEIREATQAKARLEAEKAEQEKMMKEAEKAKRAKEEEEAAKAEAEAESAAKAEEEKKAKAKADKKSKSKSKEQKVDQDKVESKEQSPVKTAGESTKKSLPVKSTNESETLPLKDSVSSTVAEDGKKKKAARAKKSDGKDGGEAKVSSTDAVDRIATPSPKKIRIESSEVKTGDASVRAVNSAPSKTASNTEECAICFAKEHNKFLCPIIDAGRESVEKHYQSLKAKGRCKTKLENEACKLLEGWLKKNKFNEGAEEQQSQQNELLLFRRRNPNDPLSRRLYEAERLEDLQEQRESYEALEREMLKLKNSKAKTAKKINGQNTSAPASAALEGIKDIIEKVHKDQAKMGIRRLPSTSSNEIGRGNANVHLPLSPSKPSLTSSDETDQLQSSPSLPSFELSRSNGKMNSIISPTSSESELATSPMLMAEGDQSKGNDTIKEISLAASVEDSPKDEDDDDSDGSSDTSDDSAEGNQETSSVVEDDDDSGSVGEKGDITAKDTSESISMSEDEREKPVEEEEEEVDEIEATQENSKPLGKSSWIGSLLGFKSTQEQSTPSQISSTPPSAQRLPQESQEKIITSTPTSSNRPRLAGVPRMSQLYGSKTHSPYVQMGTPKRSPIVKNGPVNSPTKRKVEHVIDSDSDDHSDGSDSDNDTKKDTLPSSAKRAGQQQKKKPRKSLLSQLQPA